MEKIIQIRNFISIFMIGILLISCSTSKTIGLDIKNGNVKAVIVEAHNLPKETITGAVLGAVTGAGIGLVVGSLASFPFLFSAEYYGLVLSIFWGSIATGTFIGSISGSSIEKAIEEEKVKYILRNDEGQIFSVTQTKKNIFYVGEEVMVIFKNNKPQIISIN